MTIRSSNLDAVETIILPPVRDLGDGFSVRRALPSAHRRMVGPFIFFDQMGPAAFRSGEGLDVRPHPHIGLATVTYLLEGEILHRDSVGSVQAIRPGEVNWMTAGSGIVHSERTGPETRAAGTPLFGLQTWVALPSDREETTAGFAHHKADAIPKTDADGVAMTVIVGRHDGLVSPVATFSDMVYADIALAPGARYQLRAEHVERAIYVVSGEIGRASAARGARLMLIGGEPFPEQRHIYWNFVSSRSERIEQAKQDWRERRFAGVPDEHEFIPLPDEPQPVAYP